MVIGRCCQVTGDVRVRVPMTLGGIAKADPKRPPLVVQVKPKNVASAPSQPPAEDGGKEEDKKEAASVTRQPAPSPAEENAVNCPSATPELHGEHLKAPDMPPANKREEVGPKELRGSGGSGEGLREGSQVAKKEEAKPKRERHIYKKEVGMHTPPPSLPPRWWVLFLLDFADCPPHQIACTCCRGALPYIPVTPRSQLRMTIKGAKEIVTPTGLESTGEVVITMTARGRDLLDLMAAKTMSIGTGILLPKKEKSSSRARCCIPRCSRPTPGMT